MLLQRQPHMVHILCRGIFSPAVNSSYLSLPNILGFPCEGRGERVWLAARRRGGRQTQCGLNAKRPRWQKRGRETHWIPVPLAAFGGARERESRLQNAKYVYAEIAEAEGRNEGGKEGSPHQTHPSRLRTTARSKQAKALHIRLEVVEVFVIDFY